LAAGRGVGALRIGGRKYADLPATKCIGIPPIAERPATPDPLAMLSGFTNPSEESP
jgi:hypothetical protein